VVLAASVQRFDLAVGDRPRPASDLGSMHALRRLVREWRPEIVHAHGVKAALLTLSAFRRGRPPTLVTFHNLWQGGPLTLPLRLVSMRATAAIAVSESVRGRLAEHGIRPRRLVVIRNGLDLSAFPPAPGARSSLSPPADRPFTAAFLGRLTEEKGVPVLLEAVALLPKTSRVRVIVAGEGPLREVVEAAALRCERLEYRGQATEVLPVYHAADAVVLPSLAEGHPLTALEAMSCGLPVVASRVGGLPETVIDGETGLLLPPGDAEALAGALVRLEGDSGLRRAMGAAGRARVEAEFSVERMLDQVVEVYRGVLE
jgi:glycosyltransferase involved in cell wall biosynthesis